MKHDLKEVVDVLAKRTDYLEAILKVVGDRPEVEALIDEVVDEEWIYEVYRGDAQDEICRMREEREE